MRSGRTGWRTSADNAGLSGVDVRSYLVASGTHTRGEALGLVAPLTRYLTARSGARRVRPRDGRMPLTGYLPKGAVGADSSPS